MRVLFLNQFYWPDTAATGQLLSDIAEHLADSGETVDVICGSANYGGSNRESPSKVGVTRLSTPPFSPGIAARLSSYVSFMVGSLWHGMRHPAPDVVITLTTPPLLSLVGMMIQKLRGSRHIIWEMDVYPDIATDLGVLKRGSLSARVFGWLADLPRRRADRVIVLGDCMRARLLAHGLDEDKIHVAENWADSDEEHGWNRYSHHYGRPELSIVYSGNLGRAHDVKTIAAAMASLNGSDARFQFIFGGGGTQHAWLKDFCEKNGVENASFLPYCERSELRARLVSGDIGLVTQHTGSAGSVVPSKCYGIMAAGLPVLFIGPRHSTTALMIERYGCGWRIDNNDTQALVELLRNLSDRRELIYAAGERAYQTFVKRYQRSLGVARVAAALQTGTAWETESPIRVTNCGKQPMTESADTRVVQSN